MPHEDVVPPLAISHGLRAFEWQLEPCKLGYCGSHGRASSYERGERGMHPLRIRKEIEANQLLKEKRAAEQLKREEERKAQYRRLAEQLGMDTE